MSHDELIKAVRDHFLGMTDRVVWCDMQIGPVGSPRPDVYTITKSFVRPVAAVYEIKASVADFRADVTAGKYLKYFDFASSVTFVVPRGLITRDAVPIRCGLMTVSPDGKVTQTRRAIQSANPAWLTHEAVKLLIDGVDRSEGRHRERTRSIHARVDAALAKKFGKELADDLRLFRYRRNEAALQENLWADRTKRLEEAYQTKHKELQKHQAGYEAELREALGLLPGDSIYNEIQRIKALARDAAAAQKDMLQHIQNDLLVVRETALRALRRTNELLGVPNEHQHG